MGNKKIFFDIGVILKISKLYLFLSKNFIPLLSIVPPLPVGFLYVGAGNASFPLRPSPWLNPFVDGSYHSLISYELLVQSRPDKEYFLSFISKAVSLVCDCEYNYCKCHATFLSRIVVSDSSRHLPEDTDISFPISCTDEEDAVYPVNEDTVFHQSDVEKINETLRGATGREGVHRGMGFLPSWHALIEAVRSSSTLLFWEIFAGCASILGFAATPEHKTE